MPSGLCDNIHTMEYDTMANPKPHRGKLNNWVKVYEPDSIQYRIKGTSNVPPNELLTTNVVVHHEGDLVETLNSKYQLGLPRMEYNPPTKTLVSLDELVQVHGAEWVEVLKALTPSEKAFVLMQLMGEHTDHEQHKDFKLFAVELAETLGPDHCQTLYHLAVLATKLA